MMGQALTIAKKDIKTEFRTKEMIFSMFIFSLFIMVAFYFAFYFYSIGQEKLEPLVPPILWITFCFAGMFGLHTSFSKEKDRGSLDGLMLCPMDRSAIYFGKIISNYFLILLVDISSVIFFTMFFSYDYNGNIIPVLIVVLLGTFSFVISGTLVSGIAVNSRSIRGVLIPILLIPVILLTVLMPSINATSKALEGNILDAIPELRILGMFAVIYIALAYLLFDFVLEE
ncbi:MAG: heme exporter protein CcmB [Methanomassiliicoccales archaeon]|nr:MAG: heme exporter protein CcmB [Methanomassiliicoccales archaeon]